MEENRAKEQAKWGLESIREMVAALNVDYERLEELKDELKGMQEAVWEACDDVDNADMEQSAARRDNEDFDRTGMEDACEALEEAEEDLFQWGQRYGEELADLMADAGDCESREDAEQRIQEDPLSIEIRSGWYSLGAEPEPEEFQILLGTGGPAVRIRGELDERREPHRAWLEYQDWGTPWQFYCESGASDVLVEYARQFYFGE